MQDRNFDRLARFGYAARGVVYLIVGGLALLAALGNGGDTVGSKGALLTLLSQPFGYLLLAVVALGLLCFSGWRFAQALFDADHLGTDWHALLRRAARAVGGVVNAALAVTAAATLFGFAAANANDDSSARDWTASLMAAPLGRWLVGAIGLIVAAAAIALAVKGWRGGFQDHLDERAGRSVVAMGRIGHLARALVFLLVGGFLLLAAVQADAREAKGLGGALRTLQEQPYGWVLLALTAAGLGAFGLFQFAMARYRHIDARAVHRSAQAARMRRPAF